MKRKRAGFWKLLLCGVRKRSCRSDPVQSKILWLIVDFRLDLPHKGDCWRMQTKSCSIFRLNAKRISIKSTVYMTMKLRSSSSSQFGRPGTIDHHCFSRLILNSGRDEDFARFNQRENEIKDMQTQFKQMQLKLSSMVEAQLGLEDRARYVKRVSDYCPAHHCLKWLSTPDSNTGSSTDANETASREPESGVCRKRNS